MNRDQAATILFGAVKERKEAKRAIVQAERSLNGLTDVIRGILKMYPDLETGDEFEWGEGEEAPKGAEAVRAVLKEHSYQWMTIGDVMTELHERGWLPQSENPANAVRAALERAVGQPWGIEKGRSPDDNRVAYRYTEEEPF